MTENVNEDPELLDDPEEGVGDENSYGLQDGVTQIPEYDDSQFELPEDYELTEGEDENG